MIISELQKELDKFNLFYPPDPGSATVATMGGAVMMNAGGMRGVKYGVTRDYLLGMEIVLPSGAVMNTGGVNAKDVTGYDLTRLLCGSEGTLALATKIIVRLLPKPKTKRTLQAIYNRIDDAGNTVAKIIEAGIIPATLELMDNQIVKALEDFMHLGFPLDAEAVLLMDVDGEPETVEKQAVLIAEFCKAQGARDVRVSQSEKENEQLWVARRSAFGAVARLRPNCLVEDATVPVSNLTEAIKKVIEIAERNRVQIAVVAHAGDGNLHPLVLFDQRDKEEMERVDKAMDEIVDYALSVGGTLSGEHGIGIAKSKYLTRQLSPTALEMMRAVKKTFDPQGILNPGQLSGECGMITPELKEEVYNCIKCGLCLTPCPVYKQLYFEGASPRGKVQLIKKILEGKLEATERFHQLLFTCLLCETCTVNCPSGLKVDRLMKAMRAEVLEKFGLPWQKKMLFNLLTGDRLLPFFLFWGRAFQTPVRKLLPKKGKVGTIPYAKFPPLNKKSLRDQYPEVIRADKPKGRVLYFTGCATNYLFENVGRSVIEVLTRLGIEVVIPKGQMCCGLPIFLAGARKMALKNIQKNLELFNRDDVDAILVDCATCGAALKKEYAHILEEMGENAEAAKKMGKKVMDVSQYLGQVRSGEAFEAYHRAGDLS